MASERYWDPSPAEVEVLLSRLGIDPDSDEGEEAYSFMLSIGDDPLYWKKWNEWVNISHPTAPVNALLSEPRSQTAREKHQEDQKKEVEDRLNSEREEREKWMNQALSLSNVLSPEEGQDESAFKRAIEWLGFSLTPQPLIDDWIENGQLPSALESGVRTAMNAAEVTPGGRAWSLGTNVGIPIARSLLDLSEDREVNPSSLMSEVAIGLGGEAIPAVVNRMIPEWSRVYSSLPRGVKRHVESVKNQENPQNIAAINEALTALGLKPGLHVASSTSSSRRARDFLPDEVKKHQKNQKRAIDHKVDWTDKRRLEDVELLEETGRLPVGTSRELIGEAPYSVDEKGVKRFIDNSMLQDDKAMTDWITEKRMEARGLYDELSKNSLWEEKNRPWVRVNPSRVKKIEREAVKTIPGASAVYISESPEKDKEALEKQREEEVLRALMLLNTSDQDILRGGE